MLKALKSNIEPVSSSRFCWSRAQKWYRSNCLSLSWWSFWVGCFSTSFLVHPNLWVKIQRRNWMSTNVPETCCACLKHLTYNPRCKSSKELPRHCDFFSEDKKSMGKAECPFQKLAVWLATYLCSTAIASAVYSSKHKIMVLQRYFL